MRSILLAALACAFVALGAEARPPVVLSVRPAVYPGGTEQLRADLAKGAAWQLARQAEREVRRRRLDSLPKGPYSYAYAVVYVDTPALRRELGGWLVPADPLYDRVVVDFVVTERGGVADAQLLSAFSVELGEAVCAATGYLRPWLPAQRSTDEGWRAVSVPYRVVVRPSAVGRALEELLREREDRKKRIWKKDND